MDRPSITADLRSLLLGSSAAAIFFGITSLQTFIYFKQCTRDTSVFKAVMAFLWVLDALHLAFIIHIQHHFMVVHFAEANALLISTWSMDATSYISSIIDLIIRVIFTHRVWLLSRKKARYPIVIAVPVVVSVACLVLGIVSSSKIFQSGSVAHTSIISVTLFTALASSAAADLCIAGSHVYLLLNSQTGFKHTDTLVNTLMIYAINTSRNSPVHNQDLPRHMLNNGGLSASTALRAQTYALQYAVWTKNFIFLGVFFVLPERALLQSRLPAAYSSLTQVSLNALLATLNARASLRERSYGVSTIPLEFTTESTPQNINTSPMDRPSQGPDISLKDGLAIHVHKESVVRTDDD
ncbi:hypothetical protein ONZ45_g15456 [Pleurotus djamor]|nr:hypothetical protein ONZ45_g15456 [Pleurotus djamor]